MNERNPISVPNKSLNQLSLTGHVAFLQNMIQEAAEAASLAPQCLIGLQRVLKYEYHLHGDGFKNQAGTDTPSLSVFKHWLIFLLTGYNLNIHIRFVENILSACKRSRTLHTATLKIYVYPSAKIFDFNQIGQDATLKIHEALIGMPESEIDDFIDKLADKNRTELYRLVRKSFNEEPALQIRQYFQKELPEKKKKGRPVGKFFDLNKIFASVNQEYFESKLLCPVLKWSAQENRRRMGSYNLRTDTIIVNRALDQIDTPLFVIRFVMYHEMLHKFVGIKRKNGRNYAHTSKFRNYEKQFAEYAEAKEYLSHLRIDQHKK